MQTEKNTHRNGVDNVISTCEEILKSKDIVETTFLVSANYLFNVI